MLEPLLMANHDVGVETVDATNPSLETDDMPESGASSATDQ